MENITYTYGECYTSLSNLRRNYTKLQRMPSPFRSRVFENDTKKAMENATYNPWKMLQGIYGNGHGRSVAKLHF